jgi:hypothetical protein
MLQEKDGNAAKIFKLIAFNQEKQCASTLGKACDNAVQDGCEE